MRDYGKVHSSFWSSETIRSLTEDGRMLAIYLLTSPHNTIAGTFRLPDGYACEDLQWTPERVAGGFDELLAKGFAVRCHLTKWVWVRKHLEWNPPENPNQKKAAIKILVNIPDECIWKRSIFEREGEFLGLPQLPAPNPSETLAEPFATPVANQEQKQEQEQDSQPDQTGTNLRDITKGRAA